MATIKEDYVSFETAKLLKEKGFDKDFDADIVKWYNVDGEDENLCSLVDFKIYKCPSLAMAMKWLREVHNINIEIRCNKNNIEAFIMTIEDLPKCLCRGILSNRYEQVVEASIKYCLENLI